jgi:hypothetical protein
MNASDMVTELLAHQHFGRRIIGEVSIHRPASGKIYVAAFTGPAGGQTWRSTGSADRDEAMAIAKEFEFVW